MASLLITHFQMLARYNTLANQTLYEACARLDVGEREKERPGSFRSIHRTLNHILLGDQVWMERFTGGGATTPPLDTVLHAGFPALRAARETEDSRIEAFMAALTDQFPATEFRYTNNRGNLHIDPAPLVLAHFFNHQTHHRGQVHVMLSQTEVQPPSLDMHRLIRPNAVYRVQSLS
jgi:uncharacterized damage-inducible protein DinB